MTKRSLTKSRGLIRQKGLITFAVTQLEVADRMSDLKNSRQ